MIFLYTFFCLMCFYISVRAYRKYINPITIYTVIWYICLLLHDIPSSGYYSLSSRTYQMIILSHIVFVIGCLLPRYIKISNLSFNFKQRYEEEKKHPLEKSLTILSILAAFSVYPSFIRILRSSGFHILTNLGKMYSQDVFTVSESSLSLSSLTFVLCVFSGLYLSRYGFSRYLFLPFSNIVFMALSNGSRGTLIIMMTLLFAPITLVGKRDIEINKTIRKNKKKIIAVLLLLFLIVAISTQSRNNAQGRGLSFFNSLVSFLSGYLATGVACLNEYIKDPTVVGYPQFFFRVPYIFLNKLHITNVDTYFWLETYYTPKASNVITYIGELYHDFGEWFYIIIFILALCFSFAYQKAITKDSISWITMYSCFFSLFALSFFSNFGHISPLWITGIVGSIVSWFIDHKIVSV